RQPLAAVRAGDAAGRGPAVVPLSRGARRHHRIRGPGSGGAGGDRGLVVSFQTNPTPAADAAQPPRTEMSWRRTMVSFVLVLLLLFRLAAAAPAGIRLAAAGLALAGWLYLLLLTRRRARRLRAGILEGPSRAAAVIALMVVGYAALGILL